MIIERMTLAEFGAMKDVTLDLHPHANVIEGGNESGKTTFAAFIRFMLYGFEGKARGALERKKRLNRETGRAQGELVFSSEKGRFLLSREAREESGALKESIRLVSLDDNAEIPLTCSVGEYVLGIDATLYDEIACFSREHSLLASNARGAIAELILTQDAQKEKREASERLTGARYALGGASGILPELERERAKTEKTLYAAKSASERMASLAAELSKTREKKEEAELELEKLRALESAYEHMLIIRRYDSLHTLEEQSARAHRHLEAFKEKNAFDGFLPDESYLESITEKRVLIADAARQISKASAARKQAEEQPPLSDFNVECLAKAAKNGGLHRVKETSARLLRATLLNFLGVFFCLAVTAALIFCGIFLYGTSIGLSMTLFMLGAAALLSSLAFASRVRRHRKAHLYLANTYGANLSSELGERLRELESERLRETLRVRTLRESAEAEEAAVKTCSALVAALSDTAAMFGRSISPTQTSKNLEDLENDVRAYLSECKSMQDACDSLDSQISRMREELKGYSEVSVRAKVSPRKRENLLQLEKEDRIPEITRGIRIYMHRIDKLDEEIRALEDSLAKTGKEVGSVALIESELLALDARIAAIRHTCHVLLLAEKEIAQASDRMHREVAPYLSRKVSAFMKHLTDGACESVSVNGDFAVSYRTKAGSLGELSLSDAMQELSRMSLRLSLCSLLCPEMPPVCFDESFSRLDDRRLSLLLSALSDREATPSAQLFFFSCHAREREALETMGIPHSHTYISR